MMLFILQGIAWLAFGVAFTLVGTVVIYSIPILAMELLVRATDRMFRW